MTGFDLACCCLVRRILAFDWRVAGEFGLCKGGLCGSGQGWSNLLVSRFLQRG
ncbi:unnamed protein product [Arabidopsis lyrata]|nr:unnamed protein product [Arabidopsis lyrata]